MKIIATILCLVPILALKEVNAGCEECIIERGNQNINDGPCFISNTPYGQRPVCIGKEGRKIFDCSKEDVHCKLTNKTLEDCGTPLISPDGLGFHGGNPDQCDSKIAIYDDCMADSDYYKCRFGSTHTMAKYGCGSGSYCQDVCSYGLTSQAEIDSIVNKHNELRAKVANCHETLAYNTDAPQPCAKNMNKLKWDPELAKVAQRWAQACDGYHDTNRAVHGYSSVGQNYAAFWSSNVTSLTSPEASIQAWYDEVKDMSPKAVSAFSTGPSFAAPGKPISHYTQVVWAKTTHVGCGRLIYEYPFTNATTTLFAEAFVCNYGNGGNILGSPIYDIASSPADVGTGCSGTVENGLCV